MKIAGFCAHVRRSLAEGQPCCVQVADRGREGLRHDGGDAGLGGGAYRRHCRGFRYRTGGGANAADLIYSRKRAVNILNWQLSHRADSVARTLADRHYNRQKPGTDQFVPPGRCVVLLSRCARAFWVTSWPFPEYVRHAWPGAWVCSAFRNEGAGLSSDLIRQAVAATRWRYSEAPTLGMVTFVDPAKVKRPADGKSFGYCYIKAGFRPVGSTKGGLLAYQILPADMPEPDAPVGAEYDLFAQPHDQT